MNCKRKIHACIAIGQSFFSADFREVKTLILLLLFGIGPLFSQDLRFTQIHASETFLNPAFAGSSPDSRIALNFRDQWPNMPQTYISYRFSFDGYVGAINSGLGACVYQDVQGDNTLKTTNLGFQYMYQAGLSEDLALNIGMQFNFAQMNLNWQNLQFYDQIDLLYGFNDILGNPNPTTEPIPGSLSSSYFDMGAGALLLSRSFYIGFSAYHFTQPTVSFFGDNSSKMPVSFSGQAGLLMKSAARRDPLIFNPILVYTNQAGFQQIQFGAYLRKSILLTGLFFKHNTEALSDISLCAGISKDLFSFAYSYDITTGGLQGATGGAHEVSLIFNIPESKSHVTRKNQKDMLGCPRVL